MRLQKEDLPPPNPNPQDSTLFTEIESYFTKHNIALTHLETLNSYRHRICKVEVKDPLKIQSFETQANYLDKILGLPNVKITSCSGLARTYNIEVEKKEFLSGAILAK